MPIWKNISINPNDLENSIQQFEIELNRRIRYYFQNITSNQLILNLNDITGTLNLGKGGTGTALAAPAGDRIMFYDISGSTMNWLEVGSGLSLSGTTLALDSGAEVGVTKLKVTDLTANRLIYADASKYLTSVSDLSSWVAGTTNQVTVTNDGDGTITLSLPQSINTSSNVQFGNITGSLIQGTTGKFGNVAGGNYSEFETDGTLKFNGDSTVWDDLRVEPVVRSTGLNIPAFEQYLTNGSGSRGVYLYSFSDEHVNEKEIHFTAQFPHAWKGSAVSPHVHWIPLSTENGKQVKWGLEYTWAEISATFGNTTIVYSDTTTSGDANLTAKKHYITEFADITPSSTQDGISSILIGRLFRNSSDTTNDTYTDKAGLLYIDIHFEIDTLGSRSEYIK